MRVVLVGSALDCSRLRSMLMRTPVEVVGEAPTLAAAQASECDAQAYLIASNAQTDSHSRPDVPQEPLTPRELQVLELLAEGLPNKSIATCLEISDQTVKFHVSSICGKLGATNRTDAVRRAIRRGIIGL